MATVKLFLDKRRQDISLINAYGNTDNNSYPLKVRIYRGTQSIEIFLKYKFRQNEWIEKENRVDKCFPNHKRINSAIQKRYSIITTALLDYDSIIKTMDLPSFRKLIETEIEKQINPPKSSEEIENIISQSSAQSSQISLEKFGKKLIERARKREEYATANWYKDGINSIKKFNDNKDLPINKITVSFLEDFKVHHLSKKNSKNTISVYLRAVRAITNYAIKEVFNGKRFENYPWGESGFSIPSEKTKKRAIKKETIEKLNHLKLKERSALWDSQNYFHFMFNNRGMNFIDMAKLKRKQITHTEFEDGQLISGRVEYTRSKSNKFFSIKLTRDSITILNLYEISKKEPDDFVFPIGFESSQKGWVTYQKKLTRNNRRFKALAQLIGEEDLNLTTYVARHSWATIAKTSGITTAIIGDGLGHSDSKTTETYLEEFGNDILDDANDLIVS